MSTLLIHDPVFLEHETGAHPECPQRLRAMIAKFEERGLLGRCEAGKYKPITEAAIKRLHSAEMLERAKQLAELGGGHLDADTPISPRSYEVALKSAGACLAGVDAVVTGQVTNSFSLVRPPGHHATPDKSMGFCLFNNVALAADHARTKHGLSRILVVDWDVHHGNGTQDIFYSDPDITFVSVHRYGSGFYPGTGSADESGTRDGLGTNINVPLRANTAPKTYHEQFRSAIEWAADQCKPELVILSAGFDAHRLDPVGGLGLEAGDFAELTKVMLEVAKAHAGGRLVSCLEGGYHWDAAAESAAEHLATLLDA
ncbi:MAG: histone deacetylase [Gemmataceae bacterium]|nr:histone deacetylase [Gemmataceae bacterium]